MKKTATRNRDNRLEEAVMLLMQNQATLMQNQATFLARISEMDRINSERFARIEQTMEAILRALSEHARILEALPEAIRQKIGFKPQK